MARPIKIEGSPDTRELILSAARDAFSMLGLGARLEDVADRCGLKRPSVLHHFPSKRVLLDAVVQRAVDTTRERLLAAAAETAGDSRATIARVTAELRALEDEERGLASLIMQALMSTDDTYAGVRAQIAALLDLIGMLVLSVGGPHPPEVLRAGIVHIIMGELARLALGQQSARYWGDGDAIQPLVHSFFDLGDAP